MQLRKLCLPLLCLAGFATPATAIKRVTKDIVDDLETFRAAFAEGTNNATIVQAGQEVITSLKAAVPVVEASKSFSIFSLGGLQETFKSLGTAVDESLKTVVSQRKVADDLNIVADIRAILNEALAGAAQIGAALQTKVPGVAKGKVRDAAAKLEQAFQNAIDAYA